MSRKLYKTPLDNELYSQLQKVKNEEVNKMSEAAMIARLKKISETGIDTEAALDIFKAPFDSANLMKPDEVRQAIIQIMHYYHVNRLIPDPISVSAIDERTVSINLQPIFNQNADVLISQPPHLDTPFTPNPAGSGVVFHPNIEVLKTTPGRMKHVYVFLGTNNTPHTSLFIADFSNIKKVSMNKTDFIYVIDVYNVGYGLYGEDKNNKKIMKSNTTVHGLLHSTSIINAALYTPDYVALLDHSVKVSAWGVLTLGMLTKIEEFLHNVTSVIIPTIPTKRDGTGNLNADWAERSRMDPLRNNYYETETYYYILSLKPNYSMYCELDSIFKIRNTMPINATNLTPQEKIAMLIIDMVTEMGQNTFITSISRTQPEHAELIEQINQQLQRRKGDIKSYKNSRTPLFNCMSWSQYVLGNENIKHMSPSCYDPSKCPGISTDTRGKLVGYFTKWLRTLKSPPASPTDKIDVLSRKAQIIDRRDRSRSRDRSRRSRSRDERSRSRASPPSSNNRTRRVYRSRRE